MPVYIQAVQAERPSIQPSGAPLQPLFADCADVELLAYGVPVEWLDDVKQATAATLFALVDHLPAEAAEALLQLATGGKPRMPLRAGVAYHLLRHTGQRAAHSIETSRRQRASPCRAH